jgi:hypothetical protein
MELSKKTTILFPPDLHNQLELLAKEKGTSIGELVRQACRERYRLGSKEERLEAIDRLSRLNLPVGAPDEMKRESVVESDKLVNEHVSH